MRPVWVAVTQAIRNGQVVQRHYLQVTESDLRRVAGKATQNSTQHSAVSAQCHSGENRVADWLDRFSSRIARTLDRAVCCDTVRGSASGRSKPPDWSGWESNPPGPFSEATPGLKPGAVTRSTYTPSSRSEQQWSRRSMRCISVCAASLTV